MTSSSSMTSLKQLLTLINNMVINDDVGKEVRLFVFVRVCKFVFIVFICIRFFVFVNLFVLFEFVSAFICG